MRELSTWLGNGVGSKRGVNKAPQYHNTTQTQVKNPPAGVANSTQQQSLEQLKHLSWLGPEQIIEVHRLLEYLGRDTDLESACSSSGDVSNADSGNGESEEGAIRIDNAELEPCQTAEPTMHARNPPSYQTFCARKQNGGERSSSPHVHASVTTHDETSPVTSAHCQNEDTATVEIVQPNASFRRNLPRTEIGVRNNSNSVSVHDSIEDIADDSDGASSTSGSYTPERNDGDGMDFSAVTDSAV